jgi:hypothetical protein
MKYYVKARHKYHAHQIATKGTWGFRLEISVTKDIFHEVSGAFVSRFSFFEITSTKIYDLRIF